MGYLAAIDTGSIGIQTIGGYYTTLTTSPDGAKNTPNNNGILNLNGFQVSWNTGKNVGKDANIAGNLTRVSQGSTKPIDITLTTGFLKKTQDEIDRVNYLTQWSRSKNTILLFYMARTTDEKLYFGNSVDFFKSDLKILYDVFWDKNLGSNAFGATTYGSIWYDTGVTIGASTFKPCAVPMVIDDITVNNSVDNARLEVSVVGTILENESN
jgi:hypothetical protein